MVARQGILLAVCAAALRLREARAGGAAGVNYASGGLDWKAGNNGAVKITGNQCNGTNQSPLNIVDTFGGADAQFAAVFNPTMGSLNVSYTAQERFALSVTDNTIQVNFTDAASARDGLTIPGPVGFLRARQIHFHAPSEHTLNGASWPLEMHIVHQNDARTRTAEVGVFFALSPVANYSNPLLDKFLSRLPSAATVRNTINLNTGVLDATVQVNTPAGAGIDLLTTVFSQTGTQFFYAYLGSLTTPPCSQGVFWHVMLEPLLISQAQLTAMTNLLAAAQGGLGRGANNRPVQPQNARTVSKSFTNPDEYVCAATDWKPKAQVWRVGLIALGIAFAALFFCNGICIFLWLRDRERQHREQEETLVLAQEIANQGGGPGAAKSSVGLGGKGHHK